MGTTTYAQHTVYLVVNRSGSARVRQTYPHGPLPGEYVFEVTVRIPTVRRPAVEGRVQVELPPDVPLDAEPTIDAAGPYEPRPLDVRGPRSNPEPL